MNDQPDLHDLEELTSRLGRAGTEPSAESAPEEEAEGHAASSEPTGFAVY